MNSIVPAPVRVKRAALASGEEDIRRASSQDSKKQHPLTATALVQVPSGLDPCGVSIPVEIAPTLLARWPRHFHRVHIGRGTYRPSPADTGSRDEQAIDHPSRTLGHDAPDAAGDDQMIFVSPTGSNGDEIGSRPSTEATSRSSRTSADACAATRA